MLLHRTPHSPFADISICTLISSSFSRISGLSASPKSFASAILLTSSISPSPIVGHSLAHFIASSASFTFRIHQPDTSSLTGTGHSER
ncbi:hypothetical protein DL98DRAFT_608512 [Cadophora sp. DSE1049]|nr:hypothetical protein DL98DRAFT_608512 [Cadophora sp. DSE1049]